MQIEVAMKDGRTKYRFRTRGQAIALMNRKPNAIDADECRAVACLRHFAENAEWLPARVMYLSATSISAIEQVPPEQRDLFDEVYGERERVAA